MSGYAAIPDIGAKRSQRMAAIVALVSREGSVDNADLAAALGVSLSSIRRDLAVLADHGLVQRTHGGARRQASRPELPIRLRQQSPDAKEAIARETLKLIPRTRLAIGFTGGSTTALIAQRMAKGGYANALVVTNSLPVAELVPTYPQFRVLLTGGYLRPESLEMVGAVSEATLAAVTLDIAVVGVDGISADGITTHDPVEGRTNAAMIGRARQVIVVTDGSKVGRQTEALMAPLDQVHVLVTDQSAPPPALSEIAQAGVRLIQVAAPA
ncbi:MAG: DeoR/GlpR family DNA-binding transcription regulator [Propionibacteriaceae bacterium]|nr:DeoR/GlpR family DNA-binding transcription regulator [Propionibacteriaceae bacterium]